MKRLSGIPFLPMALILLGCGPTLVETLEMEIRPYLVPCTGVGPMSCLVVRETGDTADQLMYDGIESFRFEWGLRHVLRVEKHRVPNPPQDGSSLRYVSEGVLSRQADPAWEFQTVLMGTREWTLSGDTLHLEGFRRIRFPVEADLRNLAAMKGGDRLRFRVKEGADSLLEGHSTALLP